jgi:hypothetical protein
MVERDAKTLVTRERLLRMMRFVFVLALVVSAFASNAAAQEAPERRAARSLTSEDLLGRPSAYTGAPAAASSSSNSAPSRLTPAGGLYRDPAGAFSLSLPSGSWQLNRKALEKGKLSDLRVFRKLDADGFASATASVYVLPSAANLPVGRAAQSGSDAQRSIAETLAARFLSSSAAVISADAYGPGFQVVADQLVARRAVVRALISAIERDGKLYVIVCRAPVESFDAEAREFSAISQSLAISVARSS